MMAIRIRIRNDRDHDHASLGNMQYDVVLTASYFEVISSVLVDTASRY